MKEAEQSRIRRASFPYNTGFALVALFIAAIEGCSQHAGQPAAGQSATTSRVGSPVSTPPVTQHFTGHAYENSLNRLAERRLAVKDNMGRPAVSSYDHSRTIPEVELKIVWTLASQYDWNYSVPELHGGKNLLETEYPSEPFFLEKKLGAKAYVSVSVPDTPYSFYILDGRVSPYFIDGQKSVIWHLKSADLERAFHDMTTVSTSSRRTTFSAPGGDVVTYLIVDFSNRDDSPKVTYYDEGGLP
jgi:hypothetical protein